MQLPSRLGGFELTQRLGAGAMGTVYAAVQTSLGRRVVVKTLHPHLMEDPDLIARFQREARHAAALQHPNTVQVYEFGREGDTHYIAMEYVDGLDLKEILGLLGPFPIDVATLVLRDLCRGMEAAHARDLVHRDIKPANLMITRTGVLKVMDFGLARETAESSTLTRHGSVMGSAAYMSPEQAQGLHLDARTDVFSAGVVGYEIASGERAFPGESYAAVLRAVVFDEIVPLATRRAELPPELYSVIEWMTRKDLEARCPSMGAARDTLEALAHRLALRGEDRILADFVRRADEQRMGGVAPKQPAPPPVEATEIAPRGGGASAAGSPPVGTGDSTVSEGPSERGSAPASSSPPISPGGSAVVSPTLSGQTDPGGTQGGTEPAGGGGPPRPERPVGPPPPRKRNVRQVLWFLPLIALAGAYYIWTAIRPGPEPIERSGACCLPDGSCRVLTVAECETTEGSSGAGESFEPNPCPQPAGACCLADGECRTLDPATCQREGGEFLGANTACTPSSCRPPTGACCLEDGSCRTESEEACARAGGVFRGDTDCDPNPCPRPDPEGACCIGERCEIAARTDCTTRGGAYKGDGTTCSPNPCAARPEPVQSRRFKVTTAPHLRVQIDGGRNFLNEESNSFTIELTYGVHRFRVINEGVGIDTTLVHRVREGDPNTIYLDMLKCRCVQRLQTED